MIRPRAARERRRRGLGQEQRRAQVGADEVVELGGRDRPDRRRVERRGVVHQHVEAPEARDRGRHELGQALDLVEVGAHGQRRVRAQRLEFGHQRVRGRARLVVVHHEAGARGVQPASDRGAEALGAARDQHAAVGEGQDGIHGVVSVCGRRWGGLNDTRRDSRCRGRGIRPLSVALDLPALTPEETAHVARLGERLREEIARAGGWIGFARYMQLALYEPGLGYYSAGRAEVRRRGRLRHRARSGAGVQPLPRRAMRRGAREPRWRRPARARRGLGRHGGDPARGTRAAQRAAAPLLHPRRERRPAPASAGDARRRRAAPARARRMAGPAAGPARGTGRRQRGAGRTAGRAVRAARRGGPRARRRLAARRTGVVGGAGPGAARRGRASPRARGRRRLAGGLHVGGQPRPRRLDGRGECGARARRDAVRGLRPAAPRVLRPRAQRRHAAVPFPPPLPRRSVRPAGAAGHHCLGGLHGGGRGGAGGRPRARGLHHAGALPDRQRHRRVRRATWRTSTSSSG